MLLHPQQYPGLQATFVRGDPDSVKYEVPNTQWLRILTGFLQEAALKGIGDDLRRRVSFLCCILSLFDIIHNKY